MPPSLDPDGLIRQGACDEGYKPIHAEVPLAAAAFSLREAVYAFPQGCTENEYHEWVNEMNAIMQRAIKTAQDLHKADETIVLDFFPWILHHFYILYEERQKSSLSFDLRTILVFDASLYPEVISGRNIQACHDNPEFRLEYKWMATFVDRWNAERSKKKLPLLKLDSTPYSGRYAYFAESKTVAGSTKEIPVTELVALSAKLPVDDVPLVLDSGRMTADKGKGAARSRRKPVPKEDRGRSFNTQDTPNNDPDAAISVSRTTSTSPHPSPAPIRRSSRRRAVSRSRVPHTISELNTLTSSDTPKSKKKVALDVEPSPETTDTEATPSEPEASSSTYQSETSTHQCETSTTCQCHSAQAVKFIYERAIEGGVKCIRDQNGTWVLLIPPEHERELRPRGKVMNKKSSILWIGPYLMPYLFWAHIPEDQRLEKFQPALAPCRSCAIGGWPCFLALGLSIGCVRCKYHRTGCSLTFSKNGRTIKSPYDRMLAKHMLCWQIHRFVKNEEPFLIYLDYTGFNFMPGVQEGYMPGTRSGKSSERDAAIIGLQEELATNGARWKERWLGMDYVEAKKTWQLLKEEGSDSSFASEVLDKTPEPNSMLPSDIQQTLDKYYKQQHAVEKQFRKTTINLTRAGLVNNVNDLRSDTTAGDPDDTDCSVEPPSSADDTSADTEGGMPIDSGDPLSGSDDDAEGSIDEDHNTERSVPEGEDESGSASVASGRLDENVGDVVMDDDAIEVDGDLNDISAAAQATTLHDVSVTTNHPQRRPTTPFPAPIDGRDPTPPTLHSDLEAQSPLPTSLLETSSLPEIVPSSSQLEDQITPHNVSVATSEEIQSQPADGIESSTRLTSQEYEELQQLRVMIPKLLAKIKELDKDFTALRKRREESETKYEHTLLRLEALEAELSTSSIQTASIHKWYRDRDERILRTIEERTERLHMQSGTSEDAVIPSLGDLHQSVLPSVNTFTPFDDLHTPILSLRPHTSDPSFHSVEQPIPIPLPGSDIPSSAIACISHPVAPPVSHSSGAIGPSSQMEDEAGDGIIEQ